MPDNLNVYLFFMKTSKLSPSVTFRIPGSVEAITVMPHELSSTVTRNDEVDGAPWNVANDTLESLLLAMATAGVPMNTPQMRAAVATTFDFISNNFGDE